MKNLYVLLAIFCFAANVSFAQQSTSFSPDIKRVAVFKNGFAFTYREGEAQIQDGWAFTNEPPIGVLGTIWGYSNSPNVKVSQLLASETEKFEKSRITDIAEMLIANEGSRIRFTDSNNSTKVFEGVYEILGKDRKFTLPRAETFQFLESNLVIALKTETGTAFFPVDTIKHIEILGQPNFEKTLLSKEKRLGIKVDGVANGQKASVGIAALERGIRWIPAYRVEVKGNPIKEAKLELEAMLINELGDLKDSEIYFVVGVPHFMFQDLMSPLSMNTAFAGVSSYFRQSAGNSRRDQFSNAIMSQVSSNEYNSEDDYDDASPTIPDEEQGNGFSAEQLFLYQAKQINLKKGERLSERLFSLTVPASEVFEWTLNDSTDTRKRYLEYSNSSNSVPYTQDLSSKVWYGLRLKNNTGMPWTTASAISFRDWKPLGQDMLTFTPVGGENILRVTPATEVIGTQKLEEISRTQTQLRYGGGNYEFDLITVKGTIKLRNIKKEPVEMVLTRNLVGDVSETSDNGKIAREGLNLQAVNPNSIVRWNLMLPSGEKEITYSYKIYVRR